MKKFFLMAGLLLSLFLQAQLQPQPVQPIHKKEAKKWFRKKEWLDGLSIKPSHSIDVMEFYRQYRANRMYWAAAFAYLKHHDLKDLSLGRHDIDGDNVYATVTESPTKNLDSTQFESHKKYIDLQYVITGEELIAVNPVSRSIVTRPYEAKRDAANYQAKGKTYKLTPGVFFIFFPGDAHRPGITPGGNKTDKKIVIKIRAAE
ncbi:MAG: YhcH/YjgK/YiaL family protein [Flavisolibacter sp.]